MISADVNGRLALGDDGTVKPNLGLEEPWALGEEGPDPPPQETVLLEARFKAFNPSALLILLFTAIPTPFLATAPPSPLSCEEG